ncbi:MAG: tRNA lysidine(34) synthetase TilS [Clostridiales bacterium]|nr:tRNA lysidine(34) synthetase TilS [Clostridiales bacterium]
MYNISVDIRRENYNGRIAAFVSGGVDSMVMLDLLVKGGADVLVVHVQHGIRPEAQADSDFVHDYCKALGLEFVQYSFDIPAMAKVSGRSIETEARLARKSVMSQLLQSGKVHKAAFAHHADDNAETVLMHILRGCGVDGLKGIESTDSVLRPLLDYTREQIVDYANQNAIPYVTDRTNFDNTYTRNFVRLEVLPLIKTRYPGAVEALNRLAKNASELLMAVDGQLDGSLIRHNGDAVELSLDALKTPFATQYVIRAAKILMPVDITRVQIQSVLALIDSKTGSKAELSGGLKAYREYDCIAFCFDGEVEDFATQFAVGCVKCGSAVVSVSEISPIPIKGKTVISSDVPGGCVFRRRREGDRFTPYGGQGKSLKKYLIDKKVPKRQRDKLVCLCDGNEVLAIVGLEVSDKCKITEQTRSAYLLEVQGE